VVKGVVTLDEVSSGKVRIIAPGTVASSTGSRSARTSSRECDDSTGDVRLWEPARPGTEAVHHLRIAIGGGSGLTTSYISPTDPITQTGTARHIAGLTFEFLYAPDTEAPGGDAHLVWIAELKALTCAENANHSLHNIQTLRGARTRDARNFARYLDETLQRWGDEAEVHYGPHTWPVWGNGEVVESSRACATPTSTSTTGRCGWPTRAGHPCRPPR
jgi:alkyl sulfatase BDS1-like metallo-beta-lactamase superfamily hydrolase